MFAPGSIGRPESIAAICFLIAIVVVDLSRCFCFAKTFARYDYARNAFSSYIGALMNFGLYV